MEAPDLVRVNLKSEMAKQKISQSELSRRSGVRQATISEVLNGKMDPTLSVLQMLADALDVQPARFFLEPTSRPA